ncbi:unnamed protein product [Auanema sp. JU1783]|nr:unnamed protein product [Auanema sp. JU1783]
MTEETVVEGDLTIDANPDVVPNNEEDKPTVDENEIINTEDLEMKDEASGDDTSDANKVAAEDGSEEAKETSDEKAEGDDNIPTEPQKIACKVARIPRKILEYIMRFEEDDVVRINVTQLRVWISTELFHMAKRVPDSNMWETEECPVLNLDIPKNSGYDIFVRSFVQENMEKEEKRIDTDRETRKKLPSNFAALSKKQKRRVIAQLTNEINKGKPDAEETEEPKDGAEESDEIQPAKEKKTANAGSNKSIVANNRKEHSNKNIASRKRHINDSTARGNKRGKPNTATRGGGVKRGASGPKPGNSGPRNMPAGQDRRDAARKTWGNTGFNPRGNMRKDWGPSPWNNGMPIPGMVNRHNYEQNYELDNQRYPAFNSGAAMRQNFDSFDRSQSPSVNRYNNSYQQFNGGQKNETNRFMDDKYGSYNSGMEMMNNNFRGTAPGKFASFPGLASSNMPNIGGYGPNTTPAGSGYVGSMMQSADAYSNFINGYNNTDRDRNEENRFNNRRHDRR